MSFHDLFDLAGRVALVTGGSKGIGKAVARAYVEAGADVVLASRTEATLRDAATEVGDGFPGKVTTVPTDLSDRTSADALVAAVLDRHGRVDILFNNAGTNRPEVLLEQSDTTWDEVIELDLTNCMRLARAVAAGMVERGWGRIVNVSSVLALASNPGRGCYSAAKAALVGMTRAHALELGPSGVTVNCLAPGPIMTDLPMSLLSDEQKQIFADRTALKRWGTVTDMIGPTMLISSDAGAYITGAVVLADGGLVCRTFD